METPLFSYGSNDLKQISKRIGLSREQVSTITLIPGILKNYKLTFVGSSKKWDNGGVATIYKKKGSKVYGTIYHGLSEEQLLILDKHEESYSRKHIYVNGIKCFVYVHNHMIFEAPPSTKYINAIRKQLLQTFTT